MITILRSKTHITRSLRIVDPNNSKGQRFQTSGAEKKVEHDYAKVEEPEPKEAPSNATAETEAEAPQVDDEFLYQDPVEHEKALDAQLEQIRKQINDVKYSWRLTLADIDNLTKKAHKETAIAREAGAEKIIKKLFPVMDNIDYCLKYKPDFSTPEFENNMEARGAFDGLEASKKQFCNALSGYDVTEIFPMIGDKFDPLLHEAVFEMDGAEYGIQPGQIGQILKAGWIKGGILLRPASVGVAKTPDVLPFDFVKSENDTSVMLEDVYDESDEENASNKDKQNKE